MGRVDPLGNGPLGAVHRLSDLLIAKSLFISQLKGCTELWGQPVEGLYDLLPEFPLFLRVHGWSFGKIESFIDARSPAPFCPTGMEGLPRDVQRDAVDPTAKRLGLSKAREGLDGPAEDLLGGVLRLPGPTQSPKDKGVDSLLNLLEEQGQRFSTPFLLVSQDELFQG
jgi:hypothetical protein